MKVIESHAHLRRNAVGFDKIVESGTFEQIWLMDLSGVKLNGIELAPQKDILQATKDFKGRVYAFGYLDLDGSADQPEKLRNMGFVGLKPYKPALPYNHPSYFPIYERAQALKMPILFHTGLVAKSPAWHAGDEKSRSFGPTCMNPQTLASIAEAFPDLQIMQGHIGWPHIDETAQNLYYYKNITCDISGYRKCIDQYPEFFDRKCNDGGEPRFFNQKVRFATDSFYGAPTDNRDALRLLEFWRAYFDFVGSVYYRWGSAQQQDNFFYSNALKIKEYCGWD